jgi:eukaryotic-like serine/threonine-protein kinase
MMLMGTGRTSDALIGRRFARGLYLVEKRLGAGSSGDVYLARDDQQRPVAIKFLREEGADRITVERFEREGTKYGVMFRHPNVVRVLHYGEEEGRFFVVSEFIDGRTLSQELSATGPFAVGEALRVTEEIAEALLAAHQANVVHRDLKPGNVMIQSADRAVKLLDFGIAKDLLRRSDLTATEEFVGTPGYSSPEQTWGPDIDHRVDIFALGAVLYELLTGQFAFQGKTTAEVLDATRNLDPIPPTRFNKGVTKPVVTLISRMLQKNRRRRPADMSEVIAALRSIQQALPASIDAQRRSGIVAWLQRLVGGEA